MKKIVLLIITAVAAILPVFAAWMDFGIDHTIKILKVMWPLYLLFIIPIVAIFKLYKKKDTVITVGENSLPVYRNPPPPPAPLKNKNMNIPVTKEALESLHFKQEIISQTSDETKYQWTRGEIKVYLENQEVYVSNIKTDVKTEEDLIRLIKIFYGDVKLDMIETKNEMQAEIIKLLIRFENMFPNHYLLSNHIVSSAFSYSGTMYGHDFKLNIKRKDD